MTATRLASATLLAVVALTCDITDVAEPPTDNPDAELELTPQDLAQKWIDRLNSIQTIRFPRSVLQSSGTPLEFLETLVAYQDLPVAPAEDREADENPETETKPAISGIVAQTIVESDSPREADLVLADEPLVRVGMLDGPDEYLFGDITGARRSRSESLQRSHLCAERRSGVRRMAGKRVG